LDDRDRPEPRRREAPPARRVWPIVVVTLVLLLVLGGGGFAVWYYLFRDLPADLRLVPADAQAFASVRVADVWKSDDVKNVLGQLPPPVRAGISAQEAAFGLTLGDVDRVTGVVGDTSGEEPAIWVIVSTTKAYDEKKLRQQIVPGGTEETQGKHKFVVGVGPKPPAMYFHTDHIFVLGTKKGVQACIDQADSRKSEGPLKAALKEAAGKRNLVAAGVPPADLVDRMRKEMPPEAKSFEALLDAKVVMITSDLIGSSQRTELTLTYPDADKANKAKSAAEILKNLAVQKFEEFKGMVGGPMMPPQGKMIFDKADAALKGMKVEQKKENVVVAIKYEGGSADSAVMLGMLLPAVQKVREAAGRAQGSNNLKQIVIGMHNYEAVNGNFPPAASFNAKGQPLLSWRVHILPYIEEEALYKEFHLDEPWNSPHNIKLLDRMPKTYSVPGQAPNDSNTHYQVFVSPGAPFQSPSAPFSNKFNPGAPPHFVNPLRMIQITDGTSNTFAVVESSRAVPWTAPQDIAFVPGPAGFFPTGLGLPGANTFAVAFFDGTVRAMPKTINPQTLQAAITHNGGENVDLP
jgi:hypothetical protein